jgi:hypothetical protein
VSWAPCTCAGNGDWNYLVINVWGFVNDKELYALYSPNIIPVIKSSRLTWVGHVAHVGARRGFGEGRRPLERPRHRWEDNIKMDLRQVCWGEGEWAGLT